MSIFKSPLTGKFIGCIIRKPFSPHTTFVYAYVLYHYLDINQLSIKVVKISGDKRKASWMRGIKTFNISESYVINVFGCLLENRL